jgi:hypothetical protein
MAVLAAPAAPLSAVIPPAAGPTCTLQRSGSLWQLGIEAQELTTAIGQLAQKLAADDDDTRAQALDEQKAALLAGNGNKAALAAKADALEESLVLVLTRLKPTATRFSFLNHELSSSKSSAFVIDVARGSGCCRWSSAAGETGLSQGIRPGE